MTKYPPDVQRGIDKAAWILENEGYETFIRWLRKNKEEEAKRRIEPCKTRRRPS